MYLHIVSFDIPYPANYGGVIVIFNQLKALHAQGVKIILHCYQYGERSPQPELERYCHEVHYYPRPRTLIYQLSIFPFIMTTRNSRALLRRLRQDNYPILFEGMHTSLMVWHKKLRHRQKIVRMHNVEWQYYEGLSQLTDEVKRKFYFFMESIKLQRTEPYVVLHADEVIALSHNDYEYFRQIKANTHLIPPFHPNTTVESQTGRGEFVLFHGKLSVPDNERSALWLIDEVFRDLDIPFVIAGMEPSKKLKDAVARFEHIRLVENPSEQEMSELIKQAHINLLVSFQVSGIKLKLVNALYRGRFCIVNDDMVSGSGLQSLCYVRNSARSIRQTIEALMNAPFEEARIQERRIMLQRDYSNAESAKKLMGVIRFDQAPAKSGGNS
ncbi:MAG: glycosyltransferase [Chitinophagales bacterium]|nr:glycosyltransferase [Chitinophagales bacterium]